MTLQLPLPTFPTLDDLVSRAISLLQEHEPTGGYWGRFSGGKDSIAIYRLAQLSGVRVSWSYSMTTIDPPEVVKHTKRHYPDVELLKPENGSFFRFMEERKGLPTRRAAWCCDVYKELAPPGTSTLILGIRAEESRNRAKRWAEYSVHEATGALAVLPIFHWASDELWTFIRREGLPYPSLYDQGFHRLGCIGCPKANRANRLSEFRRWPAYERRWRLACKRIWDRRKGTPQRDGREWFGSARFQNWEEMWEWWVLDLDLPPVREETPEGQTVLSFGQGEEPHGNQDADLPLSYSRTSRATWRTSGA